MSMGEAWDKLVQCQAKYKPGSVYTNEDVDKGTDVLGLLQFRDPSEQWCISQNLSETFQICLSFQHVTKLAIMQEQITVIALFSLGYYILCVLWFTVLSNFWTVHLGRDVRRSTSGNSPK